MLTAVQPCAAGCKPLAGVQAASAAQTAAYLNPNITKAQRKQHRDAVAAAYAAWERKDRLVKEQYIKVLGIQPGPPITISSDG
jgi:hypothetical protein